MEKNIGPRFIKETYLKNLSPSDQVKGVKQPPLVKEDVSAKETISLPQPKDLNMENFDLITAIKQRRSIRKYHPSPLSLKELTFLLWATQGIKRDLGQATLRTVPSAGARHALETYLLINRVESLTSGLYRYDPLNHALLQLKSHDSLADQITKACGGQEMIVRSAVTFIWTAIPYRMNWRYGERGYRYLFLDAGHVGQNLYLASEAIGCGVCAIAAYFDEEINSILDIDGEEELVIYLATVGKKESD